MSAEEDHQQDGLGPDQDAVKRAEEFHFDPPCLARKVGDGLFHPVEEGLVIQFAHERLPRVLPGRREFLQTVFVRVDVDHLEAVLLHGLQSPRHSPRGSSVSDRPCTSCRCGAGSPGRSGGRLSNFFLETTTAPDASASGTFIMYFTRVFHWKRHGCQRRSIRAVDQAGLKRRENVHHGERNRVDAKCAEGCLGDRIPLPHPHLHAIHVGHVRTGVLVNTYTNPTSAQPSRTKSFLSELLVEFRIENGVKVIHLRVVLEKERGVQDAQLRGTSRRRPRR